MSVLKIVLAPNSVFTTKTDLVTVFDNDLRDLISNMVATLYYHNALGLGANMLGILKSIIVVDLQENNTKDLYVMINPQLLYSSSDQVMLREASLSFPGISALIPRADSIQVTYRNVTGEQKTLAANGMLARVILHEMDYLQGRTFLDELSPLKKKILMSKLKKKNR